MKVVFIFFSALMISSISYHSHAQCNEWETLLGYKEVYVRDIARDRFGNLYAVGSFSSSNFNIGTTHVQLYGVFSLFILKFNKDLSLDWARSVGNDSQEFAESIEVDKDDNIIVAGYFYSQSIMFGCIQLIKSGRADMFVVKYSSHGDALWALGTTGIEDGFYAEIAITESNDIIVSSAFVAGHAAFDGKPIQGFGGMDSFVVSLSSMGDVNWIKSFGGVGSDNPDYIEGLDVDSKGNILITGFFESPRIDFDGFAVYAITISENYFVAKLDSLGNALWAKGPQAPVDQSGFDIAVDQNDNIYVIGRFYGNETKIGSITLTSHGEGDAFVVKYDPQGNVLAGKNFGGSEFDSGSKLSIDKNGNVVAAGYYYSYNFNVDSFTAVKSTFPADLFIVTFDSQLNAQCFKRVSGDAENHIDDIYIDNANNIWLAVESIMGGTTKFDNVFSVDDNDFSSMIVSIGNSQSFDNALPVPPFTLLLNLGNDIVKCPNEEIVLNAGVWCGASYKWSDGTMNQVLRTKQAGVYWVQVVVGGEIGRDTIVIANVPPLDVKLGTDKLICAGTESSFYFDVSQLYEAKYLWENGNSSPTRRIDAPGVYWVKVENHCQSAYDSITISNEAPLVLDLGSNKTLCKGEFITIGIDPPGNYTYEWQDESTLPIRTVTLSGLYSLSVTNACETVLDSIRIHFLEFSDLTIPNVITPNGDLKNDVFVLGEDLGGATLEVFNRWGESVYQSLDYQNDWSGDGISPGIYFCSVKGPCPDFSYKGVVHILK